MFSQYWISKEQNRKKYIGLCVVSISCSAGIELGISTANCKLNFLTVYWQLFCLSYTQVFTQGQISCGNINY